VILQTDGVMQWSIDEARSRKPGIFVETVRIGRVTASILSFQKNCRLTLKFASSVLLCWMRSGGLTQTGHPIRPVFTRCPNVGRLMFLRRVPRRSFGTELRQAIMRSIARSGLILSMYGFFFSTFGATAISMPTVAPDWK
jgi:hypothetical protein